MRVLRLAVVASMGCALLLAWASPGLAAAEKVNVAGEWEITLQTPEGTFNPTVTFQQEGEKLTGTYKGRLGESRLEGSLKDNAIKWKVSFTIEGQAVEFVYTGTVDGDTMKGTVQLGEFGSFDWTAKRKKQEK